MKIFTYLIIVALFIILLSSIIPVRVGNLWFNQYLMLIFFTLLAISVFIYSFNRLLSIFSVICLLSTFCVTNCSPRAILLLYQLYFGSLTAYGISFLNVICRKRIVKAILILAILQLIWCIVQLFNKDPFFHSIYNINKDNTVGFSGSPDQLGTFFALSSISLISLNPIFAIISALGVYFSKSSFALASLMLPSLAFLFFFNKRWFKMGLITVLVSSTLFFTSIEKLKLADFRTRFSVWKHAIASTVKGEIAFNRGDGRDLKIITKSIYGFGFGSFLNIFPYVPQQKNFNFRNEKFNHAHNDPIELFFELGWIGLISLAFLIVSFVVQYCHFRFDRELSIYFYSIVVYLLNSQGNFLSQIAMSGTLLIVFYGMYLGRLRELTNGKLSELVEN